MSGESGKRRPPDVSPRGESLESPGSMVYRSRRCGVSGLVLSLSPAPDRAFCARFPHPSGAGPLACPKLSRAAVPEQELGGSWQLAEESVTSALTWRMREARCESVPNKACSFSDFLPREVEALQREITLLEMRQRGERRAQMAQDSQRDSNSREC